jgi:hypothetical protein
LATYLDHYGTKRNFQYWIDYVQEQFDGIVSNLTLPSPSATTPIEAPMQEQGSSAQVAETHEEIMPTLRRELSGMEVVSEASSVSEAPSEVSHVSVDIPSEDTEYRTCKVSFNSIVRKNLNQDIRDDFLRRVNDALYQTSDFIMDFQLVVFTLILSMKSSEFTIGQNNEVEFNNCQGFQLDKVFPSGFQMQSDIKYSASSLSENVLRSESFCKDFGLIFREQHIQSLYTSIYGDRRPPAVIHPVFNVLAQSSHALTSLIVENTAVPARELMLMALRLYKINFKNMWANNRIINKTLNKLIEVLLKIHLAPNRAREYQEFIESKLNQELRNNTKTPQNSFHNAIRSEKYKLNSYLKKSNDDQPENKWNVKAQKSRERINNMYQSFKRPKREEKSNLGSDAAIPLEEEIPFEEVLLNEDTEDTEETETGNQDLPRRRLLSLKAVMKTLLFKRNGQTITEDGFKEEMPDITPNEIRVCVLLSNILLPYVPSKANYHQVAFQLPLVLLANDVFRCAGYNKFVMDLCPTSNHGSLHSLRMDAASLYALFCQKNEDDQMTIFDFEGYAIDLTQKARTYKDATFNSLFDIKAIYNACRLKGLEFAHSLTILPGLKSVRILGSKAVTKKPTEKSPSNESRIKDLPWDAIQELQLKSDDVLKTNITDLSEQIKEVSAKLKVESRKSKQNAFSSRIKALKKRWKEDHSVYDDIQELKSDRYTAFCKVQTLKQQLSSLRSHQFHIRKAIQYRGKEIPKPNDIEQPIHNEETLAKSNFSGTDNGLKVMTETVAMGMEKYKYHLNLHNRYSPLATTDDLPDDDNFEPLPVSYKMYAADIDFGTGNYKRRRLVEKDKRETERGKQAQMVERKLAESSAFLAKHVNDIQPSLISRKQDIKTLRPFYHSKKMVNLNRKTESIDKRFRSRVCSKERSFCSGTSGQDSLIMFIGDRGTCVGSTLKGHLKYGGRWKPKLHAVSSLVKFTNEHKTSQTCMYCFNPIMHPLKNVIIKGKQLAKPPMGHFYV